MVATAAKPLRYNGFSHTPTAVCRYAPKPVKMHRSVYTGKWGLCDCIHLLKLVDSANGADGMLGDVVASGYVID